MAEGSDLCEIAELGSECTVSLSARGRSPKPHGRPFAVAMKEEMAFLAGPSVDSEGSQVLHDPGT